MLEASSETSSSFSERRNIPRAPFRSRSIRSFVEGDFIVLDPPICTISLFRSSGLLSFSFRYKATLVIKRQHNHYFFVNLPFLSLV